MEVNGEINKIKSENKYFFPIASWIMFMFISFIRFSGINSVVKLIKDVYPEMSKYEIRLDMAQLVFFIAIYLMLSTIIQFIKNERIKLFYYLSSITVIMVSFILIEDYYHQNVVFMEYKGFYNPSLVPFIISIVIFIAVLINNKTEKKEQ